MKKLWSKIVPKCTPATDAEIEEAEKELGFKIHQDFKNSLKIHNPPTYSIPKLENFGYNGSLSDMVENYFTMARGAGNDDGKKIKNAWNKNFLPLFITNPEDSFYCYLCVDCVGGAICLFDFGDLIGKPRAFVVAWSFSDYLSNFAKHFQNDYFPDSQIYSDDILMLMPTCRKLEIKKTKESYNVQVALKDAYMNRTSQIKKFAPLPKKTEEGKFSAPPGVKCPVFTFLPEVVTFGEPATISENGKVISKKGDCRGVDAVATADEPLTSGKFYFEVELISTGCYTSIGIISNFGKVNEVSFVWNLFELETHIKSSNFCIGYPDASLYPDIVKDYNTFKKMDRIGVCVDIDSLLLEFFYNGRSLQVAEPQKKASSWGDTTLEERIAECKSWQVYIQASQKPICFRLIDPPAEKKHDKEEKKEKEEKEEEKEEEEKEKEEKEKGKEEDKEEKEEEKEKEKPKKATKKEGKEKLKEKEKAKEKAKEKEKEEGNVRRSTRKRTAVTRDEIEPAKKKQTNKKNK